MEKVKVLFVCMGNICRSPVAEGVFQRLVENAGLAAKVFVDSAGTHAYHEGEPPDMRSQATALRRGVDLSLLRARQVTAKDIATFDYVLAMDKENLQHLSVLCLKEKLQSRIQLFLNFAPQLSMRQVPDPYHGGSSGFDDVMDLIEIAAEGLLEDVKKRCSG